MEFRKVYVEVLARFPVVGGLRPTALVWTDGARYPIDRVRFAERAPAHVASVMPLRYTVSVGGRDRYLYFEPENMRWFVEVGG